MITLWSCEDTVGHRPYWEITHYRHNHSAFSGYRETPSRYSEIHCRKCGRFWRTKAKYVTRIPLAFPDPKC